MPKNTENGLAAPASTARFAQPPIAAQNQRMALAPESGTADPYDLARFVRAQAEVYASVVAELSSGRKRSHWIWFIFPQCDGLGSSPTARRFAIHSLGEAQAYLEHPVLGARLIECMRIVIGLHGLTASAIFGELDAMKFRSSMTLFSHAAGKGSVFEEALSRYYAGERDALTLQWLANAQQRGGAVAAR